LTQSLNFQSFQANKTSEFKELNTKLKVQSTKSKDLRPKPKAPLFNNFKIDPLRCHAMFFVS
jgi:hypothetical protein